MASGGLPLSRRSLISYLLDTDWAIQTLAQREPAASILYRVRRRVGVSIISVGEMYHVAYNSPNPVAHIDRLRGFLGMYELLSIDEPIMQRFAEVRAYLRRRGLVVPDFDIVLAATALYYDLTVLTFNRRHFERIPDLRIYQPA